MRIAMGCRTRLELEATRDEVEALLHWKGEDDSPDQGQLIGRSALGYNSK
jgi:hypothetical protein